MGVFVSDTFTGADGTNLSAHTGEVGATWAKSGGGATDDMVLTDANRVRENTVSGASARYYASGAPATNEYDVEFDIRVFSDPVADGVDLFACGRLDTATGACYAGGYSGSGGAPGHWFLNDGSDLGSFNQDLTVGNTYHLKLELRTATKKVYVDGVERISSATNALTITGKSGLGSFSGTTPSNSNILHADTFVATDTTDPRSDGKIVFTKA